MSIWKSGLDDEEDDVDDVDDVDDEDVEEGPVVLDAGAVVTLPPLDETDPPEDAEEDALVFPPSVAYLLKVIFL